MITILEFLTILETEFGELSWTICPNLEMGILSTNTFEISKKSEKLETLLQKLESQKVPNSNQNQQNENLEIKTEKTKIEEIKKDTNLQKRLINLQFNSKNPIEIAIFLSDAIKKYLENLGLKTQIRPTGAYINLDLENILWQEFLAK